MVSNPPSVIEKVFLKRPNELKHVDNEKKTFLIYLSFLLDVSKSMQYCYILQVLSEKFFYKGIINYVNDEKKNPFVIDVLKSMKYCYMCVCVCPLIDMIII